MTYTNLTFSPWPVRGTSLPVLQKYTGRYSPVSGWSYDQEFAGLSYPQMLALANTYSASGCEYTLTYADGKSTLQTVDNRGNITIDTWEIGINRIGKGWLQNPLLVAQLRALASAYTGSSVDSILKYNVARFQAKLAEGIANNKEPFATPKPVTDPPADPGLADCVFSYQNFFNAADPTFTFASVSSAIYLPIFRAYQRAQQGQTEFNFDQYCLRHTTNASNRGYFNVADTNVNSVYTYAHFIAEITNSGYWIFPAPTEILGALSAIFTGLPTADQYFMQGALKGGSPRQTTANNRVNITTEYSIDVWSTDAYNVF